MRGDPRRSAAAAVEEDSTQDEGHLEGVRRSVRCACYEQVDTQVLTVHHVRHLAHDNPCLSASAVCLGRPSPLSCRCRRRGSVRVYPTRPFSWAHWIWQCQ